MASIRRESGLSEVIGFILIIALIAAIASLYITYVVPAQGRANEIAHMQYIQDEFTGYKISMDSLWVNGRNDVTLSRTIQLGTLGSASQGSSFINLPLFTPYGSGGTMVVNGRTDTIGYAFINATTEGFPGNFTPNFTPINGPPDHLYIGFLSTNVSAGGGVRITPSNGNWVVLLNVTQVIKSAQTGTVSPIPVFTYSGSGTSSDLSDIYNYLHYDLFDWSEGLNSSVSLEPALTISIIKNGNETLSNWIIKKDIQNNVYYPVDLLDPAYGLGNDVDYSFTLLRNGISSTGEITSGTVKTNYPLPIGYNRIPQLPVPSHPSGALEYRSNNNYWIQQNYIYQDGGLFLYQPGDQAGVVKLTPSISLSNEAGILIVQITDISINSSTQAIGGTSPVEIASFVSSISENTPAGVKLAQGIPNVKQVVIQVNAQDEASALMWDGAFEQIQNNAVNNNGIPPFGNWTYIVPHVNGSTLSTFIINGPPSSVNSISVNYIRVELIPSLQTVAI